MVDQLPRIGYLYPYFPLEILYALGRVPVQLLPEAHDPADSEPYLHKNLCALLKVILARFLDDNTPTDLEGVVLADVCDAQRRLNDVWRAYANVPSLTFLDVPRRSDALGADYFFQSLAQCTSQLEARFGQTLTAEPLAGSIQLYNHQRALWHALRSAWIAGRVPTKQYYALRDLRLTGDPVMANREMETTLAQAADSELASSIEGPRLLLMGSLTVQHGLVDAIIANGHARIVAEDSACDERGGNAAIPAQGCREELLRALAISYLKSPAPRTRDLPRRLAYVANLVETRRVDGVICSYYKFCDLYLAEFPILKRFLEERHVRVLLLEDEGAADLSGQARTRLEAFLEMLSG